MKSSISLAALFVVAGTGVALAQTPTTPAPSPTPNTPTNPTPTPTPTPPSPQPTPTPMPSPAPAPTPPTAAPGATMPAPGSAAAATTPSQSPTTTMDLVRQRNMALFQGIQLNPAQRSAIDSMVNQTFGTAPVGAADTSAAARQNANLSQLDAQIRALLDASQQRTFDTNLQKYQGKPSTRP